MRKIIISIASIVLFITACDKIDDPIQSTNHTINNENSGKKILIEEFTGQLCTFCPDGAREIERLDSIYKDKIIAVSIHAGGFAEPGNGAPNDFTTEPGNIYYNSFGITSNPAAIISRVNNALVLGESQWEKEIINIKDMLPQMDISISTEYDTINRQVSINIETEWLKDGDPGITYKMQIYIIEDHVTGGQLDNGVWLADYDHRHVFRDAINGTWGINFVNSLFSGTKESFNYNYTIDNSWKDYNCEIIAFVYKEGPDYEVIQANNLEIIPKTINNKTK